MIEFDINELATIYDDILGTLESNHEGVEMCDDLSACPPDHFDLDDEPLQKEMALRQGILKRIKEHAGVEVMHRIIEKGLR